MASITLRDVSVLFPLYHGSSRSLKRTLLSIGKPRSLARDGGRVLVRALQNISLAITDGDRVGIIGPNGAGKTTLLRTMAGLYEPDEGQVEVEGRISSLLDVHLGLNPDATGHENIILCGLYRGLPLATIRQLAPEIAEFTELGEFLHMPVRTYSAGMGLRLAFAVATVGQPEILLMDEWLLAGDPRFIDKARARIDGFVRQSQILVLSSHALDIIEMWCNKIIWLDAGRIVMAGAAGEVLRRYAEGRVPSEA